MRRFPLKPTKHAGSLNIQLIVPSTTVPAPPAPPDVDRAGTFIVPFVSHGYADPQWSDFALYLNSFMTTGTATATATITHAKVYRGGDTSFCGFTTWARAWIEFTFGTGSIRPTPSTDEPPDLGTDVAIDVDCSIGFDPNPGGGSVPLEDIDGFSDLFITPSVPPSYVVVLTVVTDAGTAVWAVGGTQCY